MGDLDETAQSRAASTVKLREAPWLYVVDADARVIYSSTSSDAVSSSALTDVFRSAIARTTNDTAAMPIVFEGRLVRAEPLAAPNGGVCYAVIFERLAVNATDRSDAGGDSASTKTGR